MNTNWSCVVTDFVSHCFLTGFFVTTRLTPPSERNNIRGDYILCVTEGEIVLKSVDRYLTVVTWPVSHLRSFLSESAAGAGIKDMQLLTLHAGRLEINLLKSELFN